MAAHADAHDAEAAGAVGAFCEVGEDGAGIVIVGWNGLGGLEDIAAVGAFLIVFEDGAGGFVLVIDLGYGDDVAVAGQLDGGAMDGRGDLKYL